jgi:hypothetical protein
MTPADRENIKVSIAVNIDKLGPIVVFIACVD